MLSAVYIKGFKTFARPVRMPLEGGITAVVGPNGSGKSNVTDAVLFALGEQSPGLLRAGSMGELIFSGSDSLPAAAAAEVTLVLDNESGVISLPYAEVSITRRISRGGDADYRINGSRARLSDVRAVAGEAGLGRHSILRQGAVDAIVAGGAAACRLALEEAAGLGVYRRRRLSASRRLENADAQLEKSRQLETELANQLHRIEREATAAREYRELEARYRKLSLAYLYRVATKGLDDRRRQLTEGETRVSQLTEQEEKLRREEANFEPEIQKIEARLRGLEKTLEGLEDLSESLQGEASRTDRALFRLENQRSGEGERVRISARMEDELGKVLRALGIWRSRRRRWMRSMGKAKPGSTVCGTRGIKPGETIRNPRARSDGSPYAWRNSVPVKTSASSPKSFWKKRKLKSSRSSSKDSRKSRTRGWTARLRSWKRTCGSKGGSFRSVRRR